MPTTAATVIDAARDKHSAFDKEHHPNKGALRHLSQFVKRAHGQLTQMDPSLVTVNVTTTLPLVDHGAGIALPTGTRMVEEIIATYSATNAQPRDPYRVRLIDFVQRFAPNAPRGAAWQQGQVLYLRSPASIWQSFASVTVTLATMPTDLAELGDTLALPDTAQEWCIEEVAYYFAKREVQENDTKISLDAFRICRDEARDGFLADIANSQQGRMMFTEDVWRP